MKKKLSLTKASPQLLQEMELLEIYGGGTKVDVKALWSCTTNTHCGDAKCGNCVPQCGCSYTTCTLPNNDAIRCQK